MKHPEYYSAGKIQPIDFIKDQGLNFNMGNVVKYVCRAGRKEKDPMPDLQKAMAYLEHEMQSLTGSGEESGTEIDGKKIRLNGEEGNDAQEPEKRFYEAVRKQIE